MATLSYLVGLIICSMALTHGTGDPAAGWGLFGGGMILLAFVLWLMYLAGIRR